MALALQLAATPPEPLPASPRLFTAGSVLPAHLRRWPHCMRAAAPANAPVGPRGRLSSRLLQRSSPTFRLLPLLLLPLAWHLAAYRRLPLCRVPPPPRAATGSRGGHARVHSSYWTCAHYCCCCRRWRLVRLRSRSFLTSGRRSASTVAAATAIAACTMLLLLLLLLLGNASRANHCPVWPHRRRLHFGISRPPAAPRS